MYQAGVLATPAYFVFSGRLLLLMNFGRRYIRRYTKIYLLVDALVSDQAYADLIGKREGVVVPSLREGG